jgi:hypothetical protein
LFAAASFWFGRSHPNNVCNLVPFLALVAFRVLDRPAAEAPAVAAGDTSAKPADQKFDLATIKPCPRDAVAPPNRSGGWPRRAQVTPDFARWACLTVADLAFLAYVGPSNRLHSKNVRRSDDPEPVRNDPLAHQKVHHRG